MYHHRHSHLDLPAIPEAEEADSVVGVVSPTETIPDDDNYYNGTEQQVEGEEDDVHDDDDDGDCNDIVGYGYNSGEENSLDDDASKTESLANNSCTFSLDNVGFDDESSVMGSVAGSHSIAGANNTLANKSGGSGDECGLPSLGNVSDGNSSLFQTPPLRERYSSSSKSEQEQKLHRETCRTLGLPYNEDWLLDTNCSSSSSDVGSGSFLGSISASSGSADEVMERKQKIDKLWPWPTAKRTKKKDIVEEIGLSFDEESNKMSNSTGSSKSRTANSSSTSSSKMEASIAKISEAKSICTKNVKVAWTTLNERIQPVYDKAQSKQSPSRHLQEVDLSSIESNEQLPNLQSEINKRPSYIQQCFQPAMWANRYYESTFRTKMVVGASIILVLLCIIIVPTTIGTSHPKEVTSSSWTNGNHHVTASTSHSIPSDDKMTITAVASNSVVTATIPTETSTVVTPIIAVTKPTEATTGVVTTSTGSSLVVPIVIPTTSPVSSDLDLGETPNITTISSTTNATNSSNNNSVTNVTNNSNTNSVSNSTNNSTTNSTTITTPSCVDMGGKFTNSLGKRRTCYWLSVRAAGEVHSTILDAECGGGNAKPSELGLSCQQTCRGYNGCSTSQQSGGYQGTNSTKISINSTATSNGESGDGNSTSLSATNSSNSFAVDNSAAVNNGGENNAKSGQQGNLTSPATNSSIIGEVNADDEYVATRRYFVDTRGQARQCSFLNIRNHNRRAKRRNENCVVDSIRSTCPKYCSDYFTNNNSTEVVEGSEGNGTKNNSGNGTIVKEAALQQGTSVIEAKEDMKELGDTMTALSAIRVDAGTNDVDKSSIELVQAKEEAEQDAEDTKQQVVGVEDVVEGDTSFATVLLPCVDNAGYYLNHHGRAVQCSWLIDGHDPTNESRRIHNCGYGGGSDKDETNDVLPVATDLGKMCRNTCGTCGM